MIFGSVCSGIEAASAAWTPLGWRPAFFSEIEKFPSAVLAHHHPIVPNLGDMTNFRKWPDYEIDLLAGGTPCQSFSVAGLRRGLADPRGNLMLTYLGIAARYQPRWIVWENVPGVLSSNGGRDFGTFLDALGKLGYGFAYRVLDAQNVRTRRFPYAIPQRRRRVWVVGYLGDWRRAAAVLFDAACLRGDTAPRRETGKVITGTLNARTSGGGGLGTDFDLGGGLLEVAPTICESGGNARPGDNVQSANSLIPMIANPLTARMAKGINTTADEGQTAIPVAFDCKSSTVQHDATGGTSPLQSMKNNHSHAAVLQELAVRRLTPTECERLMGFPDDYTQVPYRKKPAEKCPDGPRYKALGNSWAVNCAEYIGERIQLIDQLG